MSVENRWTTGNIAAVIAALLTLMTIGGTVYAWGGQWGQLLERVENLETIGKQSSMDSRTLIQLQTDVAYIKDAVRDIRAFSAAAAVSIACPDDQPILVASYCRGRPMAGD